MYDPIGQYCYEPANCVRDAFIAALGAAHPIIRDIPSCCSIVQLDMICRRYGFPMYYTEEDEGRCLDSRLGQKIIWLTGIIPEDDSDEAQSHATYCTDARRVADARARGKILVLGYILLER